MNPLKSNRVLIYYPSNKSSNTIEVIAAGFIERGFDVVLLTQSAEGPLHQRMKALGVNTYSRVVTSSFSVFYYLKHILFLIKFCKQHKINAIQSHLQQANIMAVFAQFFVKANLVVCRHHLIENNRTSNIFDTIINRLAKVMVVPSKGIEDKLIQQDEISTRKVKRIPYVYNFDWYEKPSTANVTKIRADYPCKLLLIMSGRFVPLKRNELVLEAVEYLVQKKYDVKLLALDEGPGLEAAKMYVQTKGLTERVIFLGYRQNVLDYMAACDVLIHPSYTEASNNTVKEAALFEKLIIACEGVGDFSEYIIHKKNGYLVNRENPLPDILHYLEYIYAHENRHEMGASLKETVYTRFHQSKEIIHQHLELLFPKKYVS